MKIQSQLPDIYETVIRLLFLFLIIAWCGFILYPFLQIILWSLILGIALHPLHKIISAKLGGRTKLASALIISFFLLIFILPTALLTLKLVDEVKEIKASFDAGTLSIPLPNEKVKDWPLVGDKVFALWKAASVNLEQTILTYQDQLVETGKKVAQGIINATGAMVQILAAFIIAGILLVIEGVGESIRSFFRKLAGEKGDEYADVTMSTVGSVVKGIIGVALILALIHGVIFLLAGIPLAGLWTLLVFVLSLLQIPVIFVTLPIIIYLFAEQELTYAIIWTVLLVIGGLSDNVLKPILLGKGAPVPMLVIFIGVIGGFVFSGFIGLFTGAIVMSIGYKLFIGWLYSGAPVEPKVE